MRCCDCEFKFLCGDNQSALTAFERCEKRDLLLYQKYSLKDRENAKTNADRIRAMSDEELARNINRLEEGERIIRYCRELPECNADLEADTLIPQERCEQCVLHWLRQPAEED